MTSKKVKYLVKLTANIYEYNFNLFPSEAFVKFGGLLVNAITLKQCFFFTKLALPNPTIST
jgi:hypothetical protein